MALLLKTSEKSVLVMLDLYSTRAQSEMSYYITPHGTWRPTLRRDEVSFMLCYFLKHNQN